MKLEKNRCIDCLYLSYTLSELPLSLREQIKSNPKNENGIYNIRKETSCIKDFYSKDEIVKNGNIAKCPKPKWKFYVQGWKPYKEGIDPDIAYESERHESLLKWTVISAGMGLLVLIFTIYFGFIKQ
jgi:hypothetical protein